MDISQATEEQLPSHGQHQKLLGRDCSMSSLPSVAAPHQRAASTSLAETTEEHVALHKKEADPRRRRPRRTQGMKAFETKKTIDSRRCVGTSPKRRPQGGHDV
uniref:Uncharacterized protein n=1 Tax=Oryza glumipatula TaxID=40148 RepID=A0A0E0ASU9_9ORYZ